MENFEKLFDKLIREKKLDKKYLAQKLGLLDQFHNKVIESESKDIDALLDE